MRRIGNKHTFFVRLRPQIWPTKKMNPLYLAWVQAVFLFWTDLIKGVERISFKLVRINFMVCLHFAGARLEVRDRHPEWESPSSSLRSRWQWAVPSQTLTLTWATTWRFPEVPWRAAPILITDRPGNQITNYGLCAIQRSYLIEPILISRNCTGAKLNDIRVEVFVPAAKATKDYCYSFVIVVF